MTAPLTHEQLVKQLCRSVADDLDKMVTFDMYSLAEIDRLAVRLEAASMLQGLWERAKASAEVPS